MRRRRLPDFTCQHCGAAVRGGRLACPSCGASDEAGWGHRASDADDGWSDVASEAVDDFDYDDFIRREFPTPGQQRQVSGSKLWWWTTLVLLILFVLIALIPAVSSE